MAVTHALPGAGFFTAIDPGERAAAALADNTARDRGGRRPLGTGHTPRAGPPAACRRGSKDLHRPPGSPDRRRRLAELGPYADAARRPGWPSSPCTRCTPPTACVVSTLTQALDLAERFPAHQVGVTVDTYHIWWDDQAPAQIARAGAGGRIHTFQLADWTTPLPEGVLQRAAARYGDGAIDMREWKGYVEAARLHRPHRGRVVQRRPVGQGRP